jgi:Pro-kumamolisin, activation domain/Bacterial Ig-like domain (group 3)/Subtilase family
VGQRGREVTRGKFGGLRPQLKIEGQPEGIAHGKQNPEVYPMALLSSLWGRGRIVLWSSTLAFLWASNCFAQQATRIQSEIDNTARTSVLARRPSLERAEDLGGVPGTTILSGASMVFRRSDEQESRLQELLASQQDPGSPSYHKWLTPDQFAANFGMADSDIATVTAWLKQQGFVVDSIARSKNRIAFSGTVDRINATFGAQMHYYNVGGIRRYAPSNDISLPTAIASVVTTVANLDNFRPKPHVRIKKNFTSSQTGDHFLTPKDIDTIYDVTPAYTAGYTGADQSIAIAGQSQIEVSDIENFQKAAGLTVKDPTLVLVPGSGAATISSGDEAESDLDVEYSGGIATGANIYLVYVGNGANYSAFDAITYAVDARIASIISSSYGDCETDLGASSYASLNAVLEQAASQGQTVIAASGDDGSTDCFGDTDLSTAQQQALAVDFPASSQYVTGMGGSEFPAADVAPANTTYWTAANGSDVISSALSYIPEQVWNDDSLLTSQTSVTGLSSGGGGVSTLTSRPSWQTGVAGISAGGFRLVPDISLDASSNNSGYLFCSSDSTDTGVTGSCANGFRDTNNTYLTVAGGTSFDAPIFAGMVAIINQKLNSVGQGTINSTLYTLAANSTTYASAFHDITSGGNQCAAGSTYCSSAGESEYAAGTGYDSASGLGSIDFFNLLSAWPTGSSSFLDTSKTVLTAATASPAAGASDAITITVSSDSTSSTATPTGTVSIAVDGTTTNASLALSNGAATYSFSSNTAGSHTIVATYSGDSTFAGSTGTAVVAVGGVSNGGSFSVTAANLTVTDGTTGSATITVTPANGYTGTISWAVYPNTTVADACYTIANTVISGTAAATAQLSIDTNGSDCTTGGFIRGGKGRRLIARGAAIGSNGSQHRTTNTIAEASFGLVFVLGFAFNWRRRKQSIWMAVVVTAILGAIAGCGGSSTSSTTTTTEYATKGTYTLSVVGTDTTSSSTTASATMTLTID